MVYKVNATSGAPTGHPGRMLAKSAGEKKYPKNHFLELDQTQLANKLSSMQLHAPTHFHFAKTHDPCSSCSGTNLRTPKYFWEWHKLPVDLT